MSPTLDVVLCGLLGAVAMAAVQSGSAWLTGNDSFYHLRMARLLPERGFLQAFPWLHWSIFRDQFVSHHHGFHVLLLPLAWLSELLTGDLVLGGKAATAIAAGATFALLAVLLRELRAPRPWFWLLLLCCAPWHFWLRLSYVRAPIVALPLLLLALLLTIRGRAIALALLAFVFTHVYGGAVLFPLVPGAFVVACLLGGRPWRAAPGCLTGAVVGVLLGLVANPYFPANFTFLYTQLFETGLAAPSDVGSEWKTFDAWALLLQSGVLAVVWIICLIRRLRCAQAIDTTGIALLLLNCAFLLLTMKARRFVEYWPVFALLNSAELLAHQPLRPHPAWTALLRRPRVLDALRGWVAIGLVGVLAVANLRFVRQHSNPGQNIAALRSAMAYLNQNAPADALVLTDDWDIFPACFYFNRHTTYAVGLDPVFTSSRYPALWERYRKITRGELPATLPKELARGGRAEITLDDIATEFQARYVLVASDHARLHRLLRTQPDRFPIVYPAEWRAEEPLPPFTIFEVAP